MIRSLHVDIEGGRGGSSRSLYQLLSRLDRSRFEPFVAHRQQGPLEEWYRLQNIRTVHIPEIGSFVPRRRNSAKIFAASLPRLLPTRRVADRLAALVQKERINLIHLNYEGLFLLAGFLKRRTGLPILCHVRAHLPENLWGKWLVNRLSRNVDHLLFISPMEEARVRKLQTRHSADGTVIWNMSAPPLERRPASSPPEAVYLGNIDPTKGVDRLIDIAASLDEIDAPPLRLIVYGEARHAGGRYFEEMKTRIEDERLGHRLVFKGFVSNPEEVLQSAFALVRPSRENDPWGRDVIEATTFGVPVLATGSFGGVVEHGVTGFLFDPFDARAMAEKLAELLHLEETWGAISLAAWRRGENMFSGVSQVPAVSEIFERYAAIG